jgi:UDP-glucuronate 4-epimerase
MLFARQIFEELEIKVFNHGNMERDFTYIDDIVQGMLQVLVRIPGPDPGWNPDCPDPSSSSAPYRVYNIGNNRPVGLKEYIGILEKEIGKKARQNLLPLQQGDVVRTYASIEKLNHLSGFKPKTDLAAGIKLFIQWFREYYGYN